MINRSGQNRHNFFAKYTIDVTRLDLEAEMLVHAIRILLFPVLGSGPIIQLDAHSLL